MKKVISNKFYLFYTYFQIYFEFYITLLDLAIYFIKINKLYKFFLN